MKNIKMEQQNRNIWIYDIETLLNCFTYSALNVDTQEIVQHVIHSERNDINALLLHLKSCKGSIGYNNNAFDYPVLHYILTENRDTITGEEIYKIAQDIITCSNSEDLLVKYRYSIPEYKQLIPQLDLYKINHFDNNAKRTSLKDLEFWMQYPNVQDMPINHTEMITASQISLVLDYNLNDVKATYEFYKLCINKIDLRKQLCAQYGLKLMNCSDSKIGSEIFLDLLSKENHIDKQELSKQRTHRASISLKDCILPFINFKTDKFKSLIGQFRQTTIKETKGSLNNSVIYQGFKYDYGTGGIHGCIKSGVYQSDKDYIIRDCDVSGILTF